MSPVGTGIQFLDLGRLHIDLAERLDPAWMSVLLHGRFVGGPEVATFESAFARYCGAAGCVGVANGPTRSSSCSPRWGSATTTR